MPARGSSALVAGLCGVFFSGCYQGEWRRGTEVPISATTRLMTVRTVETWELSQPGGGYVLQLKGSTMPRCRHALYGKTSRTDTGTFERLGGNWWKGAAVLTGIAGGAGLGVGLGGWISLLDTKYGPPITYAAGGAIAAGGLASCLASISHGSKARYAFCGILTGFGASLLAGGALSTLPGSSSTTTTPIGGTTGTTATPSSSLIDLPTFQTITMAGGGLIGVSILTGIIGNSWQGNEDRVRTETSSSTVMWDDQQPEQACNAPASLIARSAMLNIVVENIASGPGSEERPLKVRVQLVGPGPQMVDLRSIRQALPSCGVLTVKVVPDVAYPAFQEDYTPLVSPDLLGQAVRPVFSLVLPPEGLLLEPLVAGYKPPVPAKPVLHNLSSETLRSIERACSGESATLVKPKPKAVVPVVVAPLASEQPPEQPVPSPKPSLPDDPGLTPGLLLTAPREGREDEANCSREAQKARLVDCEYQCGRNLQVMTCLTTFRSCVTAARTASQPREARTQCESIWQECVSQAGLSSSTFRACAEACADANTPALCRESKPQRLQP